jgi:hypothetical protein
MCTITTFTSSDTTAPTLGRGSTTKSNRSFRRLMTLSCLLVSFLCLSSSRLDAGEAEWTKTLALKHNAESEVVLWDKTRADLVGSTWVGEVDWAPKWSEGIGQCLYYSIVLERKPVLFLLTKRGEERFVYRAQTVCAKYKINLVVVWVR